MRKNMWKKAAAGTYLLALTITASSVVLGANVDAKQADAPPSRSFSPAALLTQSTGHGKIRAEKTEFIYRR